MPETIWNKYKKIKEIQNNNSKIKTYLTSTKPIVKEIKIKDKDEYIIIKQRLEKIKEKKIKIYDIIDNKEIIYIVIDNNEEISNKIDNIILSEKSNFIKEGIIEGHCKPISKKEIFKLFEMEKSMCKITKEMLKGQKSGSGFFCKLENFPIKYALFTNNHILDKSDIEIDEKIQINYLGKSYFNSSDNTVKKEIKITDKRRVYTSEGLDYTCIELFESDDIKDYFNIDKRIFKFDSDIFNNSDIFILQFPKDKNLSFSNGKIISFIDNKIIHNSSTEEGSSGSPIIIRSDGNYVIGLHFGRKENEDQNIYNLATYFKLILNDIKEQMNEITCVYIVDKKENGINLLHDYNKNISEWEDDFKNLYEEAGDKNKKIFENNLELYINSKKIKKFKYIYKKKEFEEINVKFKFKEKMENTSFMFYQCQYLKSIELHSFNSCNINNMSHMFSYCFSLKSIDLSSFNTCKVNNMSGMFSYCTSLESINLSSFDTSNVSNMSFMFFNCKSLKSINLSSFNTKNLNNMCSMFSNCSSLKSINLSSFDTSNVNDMSCLFSGCSSLELLDLSNFETSKVNNISYMFSHCSSLKSLDLSNFDTSKVNNMRSLFSNSFCLESIDLSSFIINEETKYNCIFNGCSSLRKKYIKIKNQKEKILNELK